MYKQITTLARLIFLFAFVILFLESCVSARDKSMKEWEKQEWQIVKVDKKKNEPTWIIHSRKQHSTNIYDFKIEGDIESTPKACVNSFKQDIHDIANATNNDSDDDYSTYEIVEESKNSLSTYVIHNEPFPLNDTEMNIRYIFFSDENGKMGVRWKEAWDDYPVQPSKKLNRVQTFRGSWTFTPTSISSNKAVNSVQFDLKGMPLWLGKPMVIKFLKRGLEDMRAIKSR